MKKYNYYRELYIDIESLRDSMNNILWYIGNLDYFKRKNNLQEAFNGLDFEIYEIKEQFNNIFGGI